MLEVPKRDIFEELWAPVLRTYKPAFQRSGQASHRKGYLVQEPDGLKENSQKKEVAE